MNEDKFNRNPWGDSESDNKNATNSKEERGNTVNFFEYLTEKSKKTKNSFNGNKNDSPVFNSGVVKLSILFLFFVWLASGVYKVNTNEQAVVLYLGKFHSITNPGLNYHLPRPIANHYKLPVTNINKEEFGFNSSSKTNLDNESLMLTGDENIIDIDFEVQWRIKDIKNYLFNLNNPKMTIRSATESAMREIIAIRPINDALANKKSEIEFEVTKLLQDILDKYSSGIEIVLVQLLRVDPPKQVIDAFRDVQTAKADKERKINEAETYKNDVTPKARGEAEAIIKDAEAYKESIIANAEGEVAKFLKVYKEYNRNKALTKKKIYLETMEEVMKNIDKVIIDENASSRVLPHLQLNNSGIKNEKK